MARSWWIKLALVTGVIFLVGTVTAAGFRFGWWGALIADAPDAPWDWFERLSWITSVASLPISLTSLASARRSPTDLPRSPRKLPAVSAIQSGEIGIHPAAWPQSSLEEPLTPYVARHVDGPLRSELDRACAQGGLVTVVGDSATGKSRSLYEALRAADLPGWRIFVPQGVDEVKGSSAWLPARTLVVLDDTPSLRFLAQGGLTAADVEALIRDRRGPVVVICILWPSAYDAITAIPAGGRVLVDPWRDSRDVLELAGGSPVMIAHTFSAQERECTAARAAATGDHRLLAALADRRFGVTQTIAGVPQLADHWTGAAVKHPTGAALLTAAIDIRRLGIRQPLTKGLLRAVFPAYLSTHDREEASRHSFRDALVYARRPLAGGLRALNRVSGMRVGNADGYELHDYLHQAGTLDHHRAPVPLAVLDVLAARITDMSELTRLALAADRLGLAPHAKALLRRVCSHDETARWRLVQLLVDERDETQLRNYLAEGLSEARVGLVELLADQHRLDEAVAHWGHPDVEDAQWWGLGEELLFRGHEELFRRLDAAGDENGHLLHLIVLEENGCEEELAALAPPADPDGDGWAQTFLARLYVRQGRIEEAIEKYDDLMQREDGDFADEATRAWAALMVNQGRENALRDWIAEYPDNALPSMFLADLLENQQRLTDLRELAAGHSTVGYRYTALLRRMGRVDELRELAASGDWLTAEDDLAALLEDLQAEDDLRRLDAAGSEPGHAHLISLLATLGRTQELRSRALAGDEKARNLLTSPVQGNSCNHIADMSDSRYLARHVQ